MSSKLTLLSKIMILVLGLPISGMVAIESHFAIWSLGISLLMMVFCLFFALKAADLYKENDSLVFHKPLQGKISVNSHEVKKVKLFKSRRHTYVWFETIKGSFLIIAPMWGKERDALLNIYNSRPEFSQSA